MRLEAYKSKACRGVMDYNFYQFYPAQIIDAGRKKGPLRAKVEEAQIRVSIYWWQYTKSEAIAI